MKAIHEVIMSKDKLYRYWLGADISDESSVCLFIMLNPSSADANTTDKTIEKCKKFARRWGYGKLWVCNLFAFRTPSPSDLKCAFDPFGYRNMDEILKSAKNANIIVCAWGNDGELEDNTGARVLDMLRNEGLASKLRHLGTTVRNQPKHPLYLPDNTEPIPFED